MYKICDLRTQRRVLLMCMAEPRRGHSAVKGALFVSAHSPSQRVPWRRLPRPRNPTARTWAAQLACTCFGGPNQTSSIAITCCARSSQESF